MLLVTRQTLAKPSTSTSGNQSGLVNTKKCNNVYFYEAPNKKIESMLEEVKKQLAHMQNDLDIIKGKKNATKGKTKGFLRALNECKNPLSREVLSQRESAKFDLGWQIFR